MLSLRSIHRSFGGTTALDDVSFDVRPGRTTGFVGANGAGKTTAMRIVVGVLAPSSGTVELDGRPLDAATRSRFGYMPEERGLYPRMKILEQLVYFARLHGRSASAARERAMGLLEHFDLADRKDDLLDSLSLGNQQRVQIAAALIHDPIALVLDEPFSGLDPLAVDSMVALLEAEVGADVPLLFSSHQLDLVERLCDDLVILSGGRLVAAGETDTLRSRGEDRYRVRSEHDDLAWVRDLGGIDVLDVDGRSALVRLAGTSAADLHARLSERSRLVEFTPDLQPLSEIFRESIR